ncbi:MAG TPA: hypothetical protein VJJ98_00625 [Sedimentisphaerales bacterium]|nr:hypothetical protein [Sedimentisphaerales bacterium]
MSDDEQVSVIKKLTDVLDELKIMYAIGGSIASSLYGTVRFTQDADITVKAFRGVAETLLYERLKDEFYLSREAMAQALDSAGSFNAVHLETSFKIDVFIQGPSEFEQQLLTRTKRVRLSNSEEKSFCVVSPEDIVLLKLGWYARSVCVSDRQWDDILGVLRVQSESLDLRYIKRWSRELGVDQLLERAICESQGE